MKKLKKWIATVSCIFFIAPIPSFNKPVFKNCDVVHRKIPIIKPRYEVVKEIGEEIKRKEDDKREALKHYLLSKYMQQIINKYNDYIEEQKRMKQEEEEELAKQNELINRGISDFSYSKEVLCHVTYYTNSDDSLQGGHIDKEGNYLVSHDEPIIALPRDIPYGSYLIFDEPVLGETIYKNVDTGGAIVWLNDYEMKVDIFVPNVSLEWIINNFHNKTVKATLYYK